MRVYMDGVFDMFHVGHLDAIKQCNNLGKVIIGIVSDKDTETYKRQPIINEQMRKEIVSSCKYVDEIIFPAPLYLTKEFIQQHNIDIVVHAFANDEDYNKQKPYFKNINLKMINYSEKISTTEIIEICKSR